MLPPRDVCLPTSRGCFNPLNLREILLYLEFTYK